TADELIDAERRKLEALKKYKKGLMQKLFPRDGEKVPEMRFPEFQTAGEWKTVRLGDILMSGSKNKVNDTSKYKKITIKLHNKGIEFSNIERKMADKRPFYIRKKDEIIIGKQNYFNGSIAIVSEEFDNTICSNAIMSFTVDKNFNNKFIYLSLSRESYLKKYSHFAAGTGQKELSEKDFLNFVLLVPSLEEQQKISEVLSTANELIDLEKRKLEALKKYKKGLMQKLFPNI
ncbi:restriction endonuclease subunit S, partial [uncultured Brachyspira sp.]|uniref:restriction endonuclease subunit S n=1 Tax=uncultured Brachyspira sp. TaxID=221953 RepID=UPI002619A7C3